VKGKYRLFSPKRGKRGKGGGNLRREGRRDHRKKKKKVSLRGKKKRGGGGKKEHETAHPIKGGEKWGKVGFSALGERAYVSKGGGKKKGGEGARSFSPGQLREGQKVAFEAPEHENEEKKALRSSATRKKEKKGRKGEATPRGRRGRGEE